jgi:predicted nucleic acid-binding protein
MSIFVDTGAWYAVADTSDRHHDPASRFYLSHAAHGQLATSDLVVAETWTLLVSHLGRPAALTFWETLRDAKLPILAIEASDLEAAWRIAQAFADQDFSFTDCTSFALMERLGIEDAFAFDRHFLVYRYGSSRHRAFHRHPA